jgi:hypothetical protein
MNVWMYFIRSQNKYSQTQKLFCIILEAGSETQSNVSSTNFVYSMGSLWTFIMFIECNSSLFIIQNNLDLFLLSPNNSRTTFILTDFFRQFLHCNAVWTLKFIERDTSYTKTASYVPFCQMKPKLKERSREPQFVQKIRLQGHVPKKSVTVLDASSSRLAHLYHRRFISLSFLYANISPVS